MSNNTDYQTKIDQIKAIEKENTKEPNIPIDVFLQEAENLHHWGKEDIEKLIAAGLDKQVLEDLPIRAGACREAQSLWMKEYNTRQESQQEWKDKSPRSYDLRDQILHTFRYAFRKDEALLNRVSAIAEGDGHADMIQDLNDLAVLGKDNKEALLLINFDAILLDDAAETADKMASLLAMANGDKQSDKEAKVIRDKAYTYLKMAVDEIRACGKYVFWRDKDKLKGYTSNYLRKK